MSFPLAWPWGGQFPGTYEYVWLTGRQGREERTGAAVPAPPSFLLGVAVHSAETYGSTRGDLGLVLWSHLALILHLQLYVMNRSTILVYVPLFLFDLKTKFYSALNKEVGYE